MRIHLLILIIFVWCVIHSLMASLTVKKAFRRWLGKDIIRVYRFAYNLFAIISFLPILWLMATLPDRRIYAIPFPWVIFSLVGQALAIIPLLVGLSQTGTWEFIGLRQLLIKEKEDDNPHELVIHGVYQQVRHPLYTAGLLFIWLTPVMSLNILTVFFILTVYTVIGAYLEERRLWQEFGQVYLEYKTKTPMFIPGLKKKR